VSWSSTEAGGGGGGHGAAAVDVFIMACTRKVFRQLPACRKLLAVGMWGVQWGHRWHRSVIGLYVAVSGLRSALADQKGPA
jgi:hypothetical protein